MNNMNTNVISLHVRHIFVMYCSVLTGYPYVMKFLIRTHTEEMNNMICGNNYMCLYIEIEDCCKQLYLSFMSFMWE